MGFEGSLRRMLFGRKPVGSTHAGSGDAPLHPAICAELQRLDLFRTGLGATAIRFVATGERGDVIDAIVALTKATPRWQQKYFDDSIAVNEAERGADVAVLKGEIAPGPELARLLMIRGATGRTGQPRDKVLTPAELVMPGFKGLIYQGLNRLSTDYTEFPWEKIIPLKTLFAHVRSIGGTMADLFAVVFNRDGPGYMREGSWGSCDDFAVYATSYPAALGQALCAVTQNLRGTGIRLAERHKATAAPEVQAAFIALLTKPFDKTDRELATSALARLEPAQLLALLERELPGADIETRNSLVQAAGRCGSPDILALLAAREPVEKAAKVKAAIQAVLEANTAVEAPAAAAGEAGYAAIDGSFVSLPERKDLGANETPPPTDEACIAFVELIELIEVRRIEQHAAYLEKYCKGREPTPPPQPYDRAVVEAAFAALTEGVRTTLPKALELMRVIRFHPEGQAWLSAVLDRLSPRGALRILAESAFDDVGALVGTGYAHNAAERFGVEFLRAGMEDGRWDLRDLTDEVRLRTIFAKNSYSYDRVSVFARLIELPGEAVWPWLAEQMVVLDEAMGLAPARHPIALDRALEALALLPRMPQRYFAKVLDVAVAEKRPLRRKAMALLRDAADLAIRIEALLDDKRQQVRINAAEWLADIRSAKSESALRKRLKKEKSDPVRAALIQALQRLGADLADVIGPATLIAEAEVAAGKAAPNLPEWLSGPNLPAVRFRDGTPVPQAVVAHWLALAIRLKDPGACGQFGIYLDQLEPGDATAFSNRVLDGWIAYDTQSSSLEEATAYALANYQNHYLWMYRASKPPEYRDEVIAAIVREKTGELLNSGSDTKGALALACRADPVWAANRVRWFLKKHGRRSNQAMALLEVLAGIGAPAALQVVIAASARLKQKSTQARAAEIAERYAEDRGWSFDELADRTVPTAGFDDDGELELPCGEDRKPYVARLDAMLAIHLFNPDGKTVKAVPAGDDEATKESKKAFATAKKELAQVVELQGGRLFEAMCVERAWAVADWRLAFHEHPVMRRLIERLVWQGLDAEGAPLALFRPTQEGDFTGADDAAVEIDGFAHVRLAHGALTDEATCRAWTAHLKDYEVKPFLAQFDTLRAPLSAEQAEADAIDDREGWKADSRTFRGLAEKRGYERVMRDGGGCNEYAKKFPSHGVIATIYHTGSHAVDENNPVALKDLRFERENYRGAFKLKDVPPVMLAECWADYHAVAAKGAFDPEWEKVAPW